MKRKVVLKVSFRSLEDGCWCSILRGGPILTQKSRSKALKVADGVPGMESASLSGEDKNIMVLTGDGINAVELTMLLRKNLGPFMLLSVEPVEYGGRLSTLESDSAVIDKFVIYEKLKNHSGQSSNVEHVPGANSTDQQQNGEVMYSDDEIDLT